MNTARTIATVKFTFSYWTLGQAMVAAMRRRRAERAELACMTDYQLRDIGLSRGEAQAIAAGLYTPDAPSTPALKAAMAWLRTWYEHRKAMRALMALDDHQLKDMGIHRSGITDAVRCGDDRTPVTATG
ncbi:DUF1127 domain-containing protein [Azospirillum soli]|uniref:DUF1127 domain-containing protein n=1 Tax=Azospirillum soli TaxID=1304799 RepID=UPI001AE6E1E5|nr:DUF1127 domain-containing protein [Azospirillum soli]MBP2314560.1 uncharacterized protein YjiS (DUF1127 family) [Azospirillum soli]